MNILPEAITLTFCNYVQMLNLLLECGVDINIRNYRGQVKILEFQLWLVNSFYFYFLIFSSYGAKQTALMLACKFGHWEIVQTLVILGADVRVFQHLSFKNWVFVINKLIIAAKSWFW